MPLLGSGCSPEALSPRVPPVAGTRSMIPQSAVFRRDASPDFTRVHPLLSFSSPAGSICRLVPSAVRTCLPWGYVPLRSRRRRERPRAARSHACLVRPRRFARPRRLRPRRVVGLFRPTATRAASFRVFPAASGAGSSPALALLMLPCEDVAPSGLGSSCWSVATDAGLARRSLDPLLVFTFLGSVSAHLGSASSRSLRS